MFDIITAQVNWEDLVLVATALGIFTGGKALHARITGNAGSNVKFNQNGNFNQKMCDERHKDRKSVV